MLANSSSVSPGAWLIVIGVGAAFCRLVWSSYQKDKKNGTLTPNRKTVRITDTAYKSRARSDRQIDNAIAKAETEGYELERMDDQRNAFGRPGGTAVLQEEDEVTMRPAGTEGTVLSASR
jgi:hypothetical protein